MPRDRKVEAALRDIEGRMVTENRNGDLRRARAISVGTCFGGTTEIMMRGNDSNVLWAPMQPVEVVELIHQLAANIGCHILLQPRDDFASWRNWKVTPEEKKRLGRWPPFVNDMAEHSDVGAKLPHPEKQPGLQPALMARSESNDQIVATQKTVGRKRTKRTATTA